MGTQRTGQALAAINDEGFFECLAMAILRAAVPEYQALTHPGVNVAARTIKSPVDGICFVQGADPPHMIAVHHTTTAGHDLREKWLHDPSTVKPRKGRKPAAPAGDLIKAAEIVAKERLRTPNLLATLVLTTNQEPDEGLVRDVEAAGRDRSLEIDLWSRSRLSNFLDNTPAGQWIRWQYLKIEQEQLSAELLQKLSKRSLEVNPPYDDPAARVPRALDAMLATSLRGDVTFLVARSGLGKTVACYRRLEAYVESGGFGIILPHEVVASATTLEQAILTALLQLQPCLANAGPSALSFCTPHRPLLLIVEDINRSGQASRLVERLLGWSHVSTGEGVDMASSWRLICPLWPEVFATMGDQVRKNTEALTIMADGFSAAEGREAVLGRARLSGHQLSPLRAAEISNALGHDPLLIALHDPEQTPAPREIVGRFVEGALSRTAAEARDYTATDYRQALQTLGGEMLANRALDAGWRQLSTWPPLRGEPLQATRQLIRQGELIRLTGSSDDQRLSFRHDRVRDWVLADAAAELERRHMLTDEMIADPYYAEIIGSALVYSCPTPGFLRRVASLNPLALFHAFRLFGNAREPQHQTILQAINDWLDEPANLGDSKLHMRWEALAKLAETESPEVPALVSKFPDWTIAGQLARFRNGDLVGGIEVCLNVKPGVGAPWRDLHIEHAKQRYGSDLIRDLDRFLVRADLDSGTRIGALRLAGYISNPGLAPAIEACWNMDAERGDHIADYLWAFGQCCEDDPARFLGPVCDAWAAFSGQPRKNGRKTTRRELVDALSQAFNKRPSLAAIEYLVQQGVHDDLRWPITYLLHRVDHPHAVRFVVQVTAELMRHFERTGEFSPFVIVAQDYWRRAQEEQGRAMSKSSRDLLLSIWRDEKNEKHLRQQAFLLWAAIQEAGDMEMLRATESSDDLADVILQQRVLRGDQHAVLEMLEGLAIDENRSWWQLGNFSWSPELMAALDGVLKRRGAQAKKVWGESFEVDLTTEQALKKLPPPDAERLLLKHWSHLRFSPPYVQIAFYVSTPRLVDAAQETLRECPEPAVLLTCLIATFGPYANGYLGVTSQAQILALAPYLDFLSPEDIHELWQTCNERGWFDLRRELLDDRLQEPHLVAEKWDRDRFVAMLDGMVARSRFWNLGHRIDHFLKADVGWSEIHATLSEWFAERRTIEALQVVATALRHQGTREDLYALKIFEEMPANEARQIIEDTEFAVRRRSIR